MTIKHPSDRDIPELKAIWKEAFGDTDQFIDCFFSLGYSSDRALALYNEKEICSVLYLFDCEFNRNKIAYVYGVATKKSHRGKGLCSALMDALHEKLRSKGYTGAILVPAEESLMRFYKKHGYKECTYTNKKSYTASKSHINIKECSCEEYFKEREKYLPSGSVKLLCGYDFLSDLVDFYIGEGFVLATSKEKKSFFAYEFLGDEKKIGDIIYSLGYSSGVLRLHGGSTPFAAYVSFQNEGVTMPSYLGFAFD